MTVKLNPETITKIATSLKIKPSEAAIVYVIKKLSPDNTPIETTKVFEVLGETYSEKTIYNNIRNLTKKKKVIKTTIAVGDGKFVDALILDDVVAATLNEIIGDEVVEFEGLEGDKFEAQTEAAKYINEYISALEEIDGFKVVHYSSLKDLADMLNVDVSYKVIEEIEKSGVDRFVKIMIIPDDDIKVTTINEALKQKNRYDPVRIKGTVIWMTKRPIKRAVVRKFKNIEFKLSEPIIKYYDYINDTVVEREIIEKTRYKGRIYENVYTLVDEDDVNLSVLKIIDEDNATITIYTYQNIDGIKIGDEIEVFGFIDSLVEKYSKGSKEKQLDTIVRAYNIRKTIKSAAAFDEDEVEKFKKFARTGDPVKNIISRLKLFSTMEIFAESILYAVVSDKRRTKIAPMTSVRDWINVLVVSDPGSGKTKTMQTFINLLNLDKIIDATEATPAGFVGRVYQDSKVNAWVVEAGALPRNHLAPAVFVDEFDKARPEIYNAILSAAEEGHVKITKAGEASFNAMTSFIAAMNTKEKLSMYDHAFEAVKLPLPTLDRFDIILAIRNRPDLGEITRGPIAFLEGGVEDDVGDEFDMDFVRDYIVYAMHFNVKGIDYEAAKLLDEVIRKIETRVRSDALDEFGDTPVLVSNASNRLYYSISRIAKSRAKLLLHEKITVDDVMYAIKFFIKTRLSLKRDTNPNIVDSVDDIDTLVSMLFGEVASDIDYIVKKQKDDLRRELIEYAAKHKTVNIATLTEKLKPKYPDLSYNEISDMIRTAAAEYGLEVVE